MEITPPLTEPTIQNPLPEFKEFPKLARLSRECTVTEKLDGTNSSVCITDYGDILYGSRTRWITPANDNHGFARWAEGNKTELMKLGPGTHFGEWWGSGIRRGYGLTKGEKRFSLFNTIRWCLHNQTPKLRPTGTNNYQEVLPPIIGLVPILYQGIFTTDACEAALLDLKTNGSKASPGFMQAEGIVVYHIAAGMGFKKTLPDDAHKGV